MSKQNFYQRLLRMNYQADEIVGILRIVEQIREDHPRMALRTIYKKIRPLTMGRDRFELLCAEHGYGVRRQKNHRVTTNSKGVIRFPNLIRDIELTGINQGFVSDITYFEINNKFHYLTFIMDLYNREVAGYSESDSLRTEFTTIPALNQLVRLRGVQNLEGAILHSDGGGQYYSNDFRELTKKLKMRNSMTQEKVNENSHAERLNGIIKNNYLYPYNPRNRKELRKYLKKAIWMYNNEKPHLALNGLTPVQYRKIHTVDNENNSKSYFPLSTAQHHHNEIKFNV